MNSSLDTNGAIFTELVDLRRQVQELQQALTQADPSPAKLEEQEHTERLEQAVAELRKEIERRQQAESALKLSEQRYQSLYEQTPYMYFTLTPDGSVVSVNSFGADQLGYQKEGLIGQSILKLFDSRDQQTVLGQLIACAASPYTLFQ